MSIVILGIAQTRGLLDKIRSTLENENELRKPFMEAGDWVLKDIDANFAKQGGLYQTSGGKRGWKPLASSTRERREAKGYGGARPILERSGALRKSFSAKYGGRTVSIESKSPYFVYHQVGGRKIPQRKMMGVRNETVPAITQILRNWINSLIR